MKKLHIFVVLNLSLSIAFYIQSAENQIALPTNNTNQIDLNLIKAAKEGNPKEMWELSKKYLEQNNMLKWFSWRNRYRIRFFQDAACTKDKSTSCAADLIIQNRHLSHTQKELYAQLFPEDNEEKIQKQLLKDALWVKKKASLPSPLWILAYDTDNYDWYKKFYEEKVKPNPQNYLLPEEQWNQIRTAFVDEQVNKIKKELNLP